MADVAVSGVLSRLAPLIEKTVRQEVGLFLNASDEAQTLVSKLTKIRQVLTDAERKGVTDRRVESWLDKLKEIAYEIEDALDEWEVEDIKQRLEESEDAPDSWVKKVCFFLQSVCLCFKQTVRRRSIALDMKSINQRLDSIDQENENEFKFIPTVGHVSQDFKRILTTSFVDVSKVCGRDHDKETLVSKLLSESSTQVEDGVKIVSIVGVGGLGKTTLAQLVFDAPEVKNHFDVKIWVCVSDPFNEIEIAKTILEALNNSSPTLSRLETLLQCIKESISGKKFLLVFDDVWTEDDTKWEPIKVSLNSDAPESCILVTTRNENVARKVGSTYTHQLKPLEDMYCWSILNQIALQKRRKREREELRKIGLEIAKKCKGLPLVAKILGGVLCRKNSLREWENVLGSDIWNIEEAKEAIFQFLILSYEELDPAVKRCLSYCAIFEKDHNILVADLIRMWMAQGYLSSSENATEMELVGRRYFEDLATRSFFQDFDRDGDGRIWRCKMHDIIHDFAQSLTKNECLIVKQTNEREKMVSTKDARHVNARNTIGEIPDALFPVCDVKRIRSLLLGTGFFPHPDGYHIFPNLFSHLKRVRLLNLRYCGLQYIPKEIGNLIHIRYLNISGNDTLAELPETICDLYNLQTFGIEFCKSLSQFPQGIHKLINLRHLLNTGLSGDFRFPQGFEKLTNLRTLEEFWAMRSSGNQLGWLKDLNQLEGTLKIYIDDSVDEVEAKKADLKNKKWLQRLTLDCWDIVRLEVLEALQPHPSLQSLDLQVSRLHLPKWIPTLTNLRSLYLRGFLLTNAGLEDLLPLLETLTLLEELSLERLEMERVGREIMSIPFPGLKKLEFRNCGRWEEWEDISSSEEEEDNDITSISFLPSLQVLIIERCPNLKALPHRLLRKVESLEVLDIYDCEHLRNRCNRESGQDWDKISHIPRVVTGTSDIVLNWLADVYDDDDVGVGGRGV